MKIVIAPDSYKESLSAAEVAQAIEKGFREIFPDAQYVSVPVADGGEGTVEAMIAATQGVERAAWVTGPLGEKVKACWGMSGDGQRTGAGSARKTQPFDYYLAGNGGADIAGAGKRRKQYHYRHWRQRDK